jgi:Major capsid protein Gp23
MGTFSLVEQLESKWQPVMEHDSLSPIKDNYRRAVTAILLENQEQALREAAPANSLGSANSLTYNDSTSLAGYDPILISLVRRAMPNLMAYDVASVQPMTSPTGLIFAMKSKYNGRTDTEALMQEAFTRFSGVTGYTSGSGPTGEASYVGDPIFGFTGSTNPSGNAGWEPGYGMSREIGENLGDASNSDFNTMAFTIERASVTAKTRALKAEYTIELAQDLKAIHGLDAETELANILSTEILAEINRETVRSIYATAVLGAQNNDLFYKSGVTYNFVTGASSTGTAGADFYNPGGVYDLIKDSDGRWSAEKFRGLMFQIEREANTIAKQTRRGKGNFIICSSDVASALAMGGFLNISPALNVNLDVDDTGNTFVGVLNGKIKVYVDPYSGVGLNTSARDFVCVGYKGTSPYDAGLFYCPYIPLQMVRAINPSTFQPKIGFKTRYGMAVNPLLAVNQPSTNVDVASNYRKNIYYRIFRVDNLHGVAQNYVG